MAVAKERTCVGCGCTSAKGDLIRFVRCQDGTVACDPSGRMPGRGAYLCPDRHCFDTARKRHALERALRIKLDEGAYDRLAAAFDPLCLGRSSQ